MAQSIDNIQLDTAWQSLNALSGIAVGAEFNIQNEGTPDVILREGAQPPADYKRGKSLCKKQSTTAVAGSLEIWARTLRSDSHVYVEAV